MQGVHDDLGGVEACDEGACGAPVGVECDLLEG